MKIYIDTNYKCHTENDGTMREVEIDFFKGKCNQFIEGYIFVPHGETWVKSEREHYDGEMIFPWKNYDTLAALQAQYEEMLAKQQDMTQALEILEVGEE